MGKNSNTKEEEEEKLHIDRSTGILPERVTPPFVKTLQPKEIFVFGSNIDGCHLGGAARIAQEKFGAVWGIGEGLQGQSYAIPTMEGFENIRQAVERFTSFAQQHQELKFLVTAIGCGIAGYTPEEIAPLFVDVTSLCNVYLPLTFWKVLQNVVN